MSNVIRHGRYPVLGITLTDKILHPRSLLFAAHATEGRNTSRNE
jgi:hypothetical protein